MAPAWVRWWRRGDPYSLVPALIPRRLPVMVLDWGQYDAAKEADGAIAKTRLTM